MRRLLATAMICLSAVGPTPSHAAAAAPLPVAIVWHQHQPQYPKLAGTQVFEQPWVRLHAAKDYVDMAAIVREYPGLKLTINLTPVLLRQIDEYNHGATDRHAQLALRPAEQLTAAERAEARQRFFQVSGPMLGRWPRLAALKRQAADAWTAADFRDAATLFHLAWCDPDMLARPPLRALAEKGRGFSEGEKRQVIAEHRKALQAVLPLHRKLQEEGRIEVTTTPYFHPILPLIADGDEAREALPDVALPRERMKRPEDARHHVEAAVADYKVRFGRAPRGMWPGEGSVSQAVAPLFKAAGVRWIATDEDVLARSRGLTLRAGEALTAAGTDALYQPYQVQDGPAIVFRDRKLSDDIGFRYAKMTGAAAAADLLGQLKAVARRPAAHPRLVTLILDGENAWENYDDDGKAFLRALYQGLTRDPAFVTTTPGEYLETHAATPLARLWAGSWIGASFATWVGEDEENRAWELLVRARDAVAAYGARRGEANPAYRRALEKLYAAEGSDWFWWYGRDQDSGQDEAFDEAYRRLLANAYRDMGEKPPSDLGVPIVVAGATPTRKPTAYLTPRIDGPLDRTEWRHAGSVFAEGGAMAAGGQPFGTLFYGWDKQNLYLAVQHTGEAQAFEVGIGPGERDGGFPFPVRATAHVSAGGQGGLGYPGLPSPVAPIPAGHGRGSSELAIPWALLKARSGTPLLLQLRAGGARFPAQPLKLAVPVLAATPLVALADAPDPGIGPGGYTPPTSGAYPPEAVDLRGLEVAEEDGAWAFTWRLGAVRDPWGSPIGLSLVTLDLYMAPGAFVEGRLPAPTPLLDARDARAARPWTHALWVEGWQQGLYGRGGERLAELAVAVDPLSAEVRAFVPKRAIPGDPRQWAYLATLAGQDGFAPGRIRAVRPVADADRFGGRAPGRGSNLLDVLLPRGQGDQAALLDPPDGRVVLPLLSPAE